MTTVVITGSTRGIGLGLADEFLKRACRVVVSGRATAAVAKAVGELAARHGQEAIHGTPCDVTDPAHVQALWDDAAARFGRVDIWINNAGVGAPRKRLHEQPLDAVRSLVHTNLLGTIYGCQTAIAGMLAQGGGHIYNVEGFGSNDLVAPGMAVYGASKRAVTYLTKSIIKELEGTPVRVGWLSPGMVVTDLLVKDYEGNPEMWAKARRLLNILSDRVETVTPALAERILANDKHGARIAWLTPAKAGVRFATARFAKRDVLGDVAPPGM